jgi:hypothetical protein
MAEVLARFSHSIVSDAAAYFAQACGAPMSDGRWEGWVEFIPLTGGELLRSPQETTQPNRIDAEYWATGLTPVYLQGALRRAQAPQVRRRIETAAEAVVPPMSGPVLNPVSIYQKGERMLRQQLGALSSWHLVNIIQAYGLSDEPNAVLNRLPSSALIVRIVGACRRWHPRD